MNLCHCHYPGLESLLTSGTKVDTDKGDEACEKMHRCYICLSAGKDLVPTFAQPLFSPAKQRQSLIVPDQRLSLLYLSTIAAPWASLPGFLRQTEFSELLCSRCYSPPPIIFCSTKRIELY